MMWPLLVIFCGLILLTRHEPDGNALPKARQLALSIINRAPRGGGCIIFDFDDTLFRPDVVVSHEFAGIRTRWNGDRRAVPMYATITEMTDVLQYAAARGFRIIVITARPDNATTRATVLANFRKRGLQMDEFHAMKPGQSSDFKARLRAEIARSEPIILTIGDQWMDVKEPGKADFIKLPNKTDGRLYASRDV